MTSDTQLSLRQITCAFGSVVAVNNLDLDIARGEFVSLLGPSGCGKTTTLRMIAGFVHPTGGTISMDGVVISSPDSALPPERRQMSMIFQSYAIWPNMTVAENVAFGLRLRRMDRATIRAKVQQMLDTVRLGHLADRYPAELSGGQQQRVALARAMVIQPRVLLLDEPLSNLDANLREEMRFEIRRLHDEFHFTTVYVTHDQGEAMVTSDRIAVMNAGRIEQIDAPYKLYTRPRTRFVASFIGRTNLLRSVCDETSVAFDRFALPRFLFENAGQSLSGEMLFSVRPQSITLRRTPADARQGTCVVQGRLIQRVFLGETWDYVVSPADSDLKLKVATPPFEVFDVGDTGLARIRPHPNGPRRILSLVIARRARSARRGNPGRTALNRHHHNARHTHRHCEEGAQRPTRQSRANPHSIAITIAHDTHIVIARRARSARRGNPGRTALSRHHRNARHTHRHCEEGAQRPTRQSRANRTQSPSP